MDDQIVAIFTITSDFLIAINHYEHPPYVMSDAEVMTTAIVSTLYFGPKRTEFDTLFRAMFESFKVGRIEL